MLLTEHNETQMMEMFKEEGRQEGENMLSRLIMKLTALGRGSEIVRAASDPAYREQLYGEFQIS